MSGDEERANEYGSTLTGDPAYDAALADWRAAVERWGHVVTWRDEQSFAAAWRRKAPAPQTMDRAAVLRALDEHQAERGHREAYCSCGVPIGEWAQGWADHFTSVILGLLTPAAVTPGEEERVAHRLIWQGLLPQVDLSLRERQVGEVLLARLAERTGTHQ